MKIFLASQAFHINADVSCFVAEVDVEFGYPIPYCTALARADKCPHGRGAGAEDVNLLQGEGKGRLEQGHIAKRRRIDEPIFKPIEAWRAASMMLGCRMNWSLVASTDGGRVSLARTWFSPR